jgi:hypothetical protein
MGADAADIGLTVHPHPTLSETVAFAAEAFDGTLTDLYLPKKRKCPGERKEGLFGDVADSNNAIARAPADPVDQPGRPGAVMEANKDLVRSTCTAGEIQLGDD